jgi:general secretion pathway protein H
MGRKVAAGRRLILSAGRSSVVSAERSGAVKSEDGFTLIEVVCVLAIIGLLAAVVVPTIPRGTSRARLEGYALEAATMLRVDRNAAIRRRGPVATEIGLHDRWLRSGATGRVLRLPQDILVEALLAARCNGRPAGSTIRFLPSGMSCGGTIALSRDGVGFQVRVNWLTGGIDVVPVQLM